MNALRHPRVLAGVLAVAAAMAAGRGLAQTPALPSLEVVGAPTTAFHESRYFLGYEIYVGKGNLVAAYRVAEKAVQLHPRDMVWRQRLAQVSLWLNQTPAALENWLAVAEQTGSAAAWKEVARLAPFVADDEIWLRLQRYQTQQNPNDPVQMSALIAAFERLGRPQDGLAFLAKFRVQHPTQLVYEAEANLAERTGQDALALADLALLNQRFGPQEGWLLRAAGLHYQRGDLARAQQVLAAAAPVMPDSALAFWQTHAELARLLGDEKTALAAYAHVYASGAYTAADLANYAALLQHTDPLAGARLQALRYHRFGDIEAVTNALYLWLREKNFAAANQFLRGLSPAQQAQLTADAGFLELRGNLHEAQNHGRHALADYGAALRLAPKRTTLRQSWLALMIEYADADTLRRHLIESAAITQNSPVLQGLWAAGWGRLGQTVRALPYLQARYRSNPAQVLSALAYADALRQTGLIEAAQQIEQSIWRSRSSAEQGLSPTLKTELRHALLLMELRKLPADARQRRLRDLVQKDREERAAAHLAGDISPWLRDVVLSAAWASEAADEFPRAVARLTSSEPVPAWARLATALADNDKPELDALLALPEQALSAGDRVEAATRLDRYDAADSLAYTAADEQPNDDSAHQRWQARLWQRANVVNLAHFNDEQTGFNRQVTALTWGGQASAHYRVQGLAETASVRITPSALQGINKHQQRAELGLIEQAENHEWGATTTLLGSAEQVWGLRLHGQWVAQPSLQLGARMGWHQRTPLSNVLALIAQQNSLGMSAAWAITGRDNLAADTDYSTVAAQGGGALGTVWINRWNYTHRLYADERDWLIKAGISRTSATNAAQLPAAVQAFTPGNAGATVADFMPRGFMQTSFAVAFGENAEQSFQRGWRGFWQLGVTHDKPTGLGYDYRVGVLGRVVGSDRLRVYVNGAKGAQNQGEGGSYTAGVDYQLFY